MKMRTLRSNILASEANKNTSVSPGSKILLQTEGNTQIPTISKNEFHERFGLQYTKKEYFHPGSFNHLITGINGSFEMSWSCCKSTDEKKKVDKILV